MFFLLKQKKTNYYFDDNYLIYKSLLL